MRIKDPPPPRPDEDAPRAPWIIPLVVGAVVAALVIWRALVGGDPDPEPSLAASASASASASAPPRPSAKPRCGAFPDDPFVIGEAKAPKPPPPPPDPS